ncbi:MAG: alpha/beta hydrolase [Actinomycetota bacterium]|nr:alpha/beta hydrolase [Actinomycetota bacterium]
MGSVKVRGARIAYEERGKGDPVILLHGWNATGKQWLHNLKALGQRHRAIAPDLPGHGDSEMGDFAFHLDGMADFLESFRKALRLPPFHLVGHSLGGCIALHYAATRPEMVRKLVLVSTPTRRAGIGLKAYLPGLPRLVSLTYRFRNESVLKWMFYRGLHKPEYQDLEFVRANVRAALKNTCGALAAAAGMIRKLDLTEDLRAVANPTLIVFGDKDRSVNPGEALRQKQELPRPYLAMITASGHCPHCERPDLFNAVVREFLEAEEP